MKKKKNKISQIRIIFLFSLLLFLEGCGTAPPINPPPSIPPEDAILVTISVLPETMTLPVGGSQTITSITANYDTAADVNISLAECSYSTDNPSVATVAAGTITGVSAGTAIITVTYTEGMITQTDTIEVDVLITGIIIYPVHNLTQNKSYFAIQDAIDDANNGDTIEVDEGTYYENIIFNGKSSITLQCSDPSDPAVVTATVIDGGGKDHVVAFLEDINSNLKGFTIQGGNTKEYGGGIYIWNSSSNINGNMIKGNTAEFHGGGIYIQGGYPTINDNTVSGNSANSWGGGIYCFESNPTIVDNTIEGNHAVTDGGGIHFYSSSGFITDNAISGNTAGRWGGGIYLCGDSNSNPTIVSNIITDNAAETTGGGIYDNLYCSPTIMNNTICGNNPDQVEPDNYPNNLIDSLCN